MGGGRVIKIAGYRRGHLLVLAKQTWPIHELRLSDCRLATIGWG